MDTRYQISNFWGLALTAFVGSSLMLNLRHDIRCLLSTRNFVLMGIGAWFLLEAVKLSPDVLKHQQSVYDYSIFCVFLATVSFLAGYHLLSPCRLFDPLARRYRELDDERVLWALVVFCGIVGFGPILYVSQLRLTALFQGIMGFRQTWGGLLARGRLGGFREALLMLEYFLRGVGPVAVILLLSRRSTMFQRVVCAAVLTWTLLRAYGSGTRYQMLGSFLPAMAVVYYQLPRLLQRQLILGGLAALPLVYTFMAAVAVSRGDGEFSWDAAEEARYVGNEMFRELVFITDNVPQKHEHLYGHSYMVQIVNPIPRFLWPGKPTGDAGILMAEMKGEVNPITGETYLTRSPGLIGEMYLNFGLLGIPVLSTFGGWLARGWDRLPQLNPQSLPTHIIFFMGLVTFFILGRSFTMNLLYNVLFLTVAVFLITTAFPQVVVSRPLQLSHDH